MAFELQMVGVTTLILFILLNYQGALVPIYQGFAWGLGSRDEPKDKTALQNRTARTVANHIEGMMLFVPLTLIVELGGLSSGLTVLGAGLYAAGRAAFAPLYLMGVAYLRSLAWGVSVLGIMLIGYEVLLALF